MGYQSGGANTGGGGGYAASLTALATAPPSGVPFISPDLATANVAPGKSGYLVNTAAGGVQVLAAAATCNTTAASNTDYLATATPVTVGTTGQRSFGSDARGTIYQDSTGTILAAPLVIEIARVLDLAKSRGDGGVQEQLSTFFKAPMVKNGHGPEHDFGKQQRMLFDWLGAQQ